MTITYENGEANKVAPYFFGRFITGPGKKNQTRGRFKYIAWVYKKEKKKEPKIVINYSIKTFVERNHNSLLIGLLFLEIKSWSERKRA